MATDVRLVTVEAQALATTFLLFRRREAAESRRRGCCRLDWSAHPSRRCGRLLTRCCWWCRTPHRRPVAALCRCRAEGDRAAFIRTRIVHRRLKILRAAHLHVRLEVLGKATHKQFGLLERVEVACMAKDGVEAVRVVLYRREEGQPRELSQPCALCRWPETKLAQAAEALPGGHALILLQCVVPCLRGAAKMIRGQPGAIRSQGALATEEWLALVEPIQRIHPAVERRELQLVVPRRSWVASRGTVQLVVVGVPFHAAIGRTLGGGSRRGEAGRRRVCSGRRGRHSRGVDRRRRQSHHPRRDFFFSNTQESCVLLY